ncbi:hypothetical protein HOT01_gp63 [Salmonella phage vB_SenS_PHB07]|uniref:Uncharacterized protein n=1 Tax=Salmonella phage vB_SenS_PHB07 TaxID=2136179 RepID=A0A2R3U9F4_9CAUD|nr:hypothetical protein HOT01_gp63 [Salmonella phage vB_SenS_PHB07]AVQ09813.1 hypothetical protein [Salmonella phage vB_SenS_PHB07]
MNRKMLIRAFAKIAKRWGDSNKSPYTFSRYGYKMLAPGVVALRITTTPKCWKISQSGLIRL